MELHWHEASDTRDTFLTMRSVSLLLLFCIASATAQTTLTPDQRHAILDYQFTMPKANSLASAVQQLSKYLASLPNSKERGLRLATMIPAELRVLMEKDSKAMAILTQNGLTVRDYLVGTNALVMAYTIAATGASNSYIFASPANIACAKAHLADLKPKMDAVRAAGRGKQDKRPLMRHSPTAENRWSGQPLSPRLL